MFTESKYNFLCPTPSPQKNTTWGLIKVPSRSVTAASSGLLRGPPLCSWPASHLHLHDVGNTAATSDADTASKTCPLHGRDEPFYQPAYFVQPFHYVMY